jgi:hypothetical protein
MNQVTLPLKQEAADDAPRGIQRSNDMRVPSSDGVETSDSTRQLAQPEKQPRCHETSLPRLSGRRQLRTPTTLNAAPTRYVKPRTETLNATRWRRGERLYMTTRNNRRNYLAVTRRRYPDVQAGTTTNLDVFKFNLRWTLPLPTTRATPKLRRTVPIVGDHPEKQPTTTRPSTLGASTPLLPSWAPQELRRIELIWPHPE